MNTKQALSQKRPKLGGCACVFGFREGRHTTLLTQGGKREIEIPRKASTHMVRSTLESLGKDLQVFFLHEIYFTEEGARFSGVPMYE